MQVASVFEIERILQSFPAIRNLVVSLNPDPYIVINPPAWFTPFSGNMAVTANCTSKIWDPMIP